MPQENFKTLRYPQPKNKFTITLTDHVTGKVEKHEIENTVGELLERCADMYYKKFPTPGLSLGNPDQYMGRTNTQTAIMLWSANNGVTSDLYLNEFKWNGTTMPASGTDESGTRVTAYNYQFATADTGTKGGRYISTLSSPQRNRAYKWVWEWGTTQGNGTINAISVGLPSYNQVTNSKQILDIGHVPEMQNTEHYTYCGFKTSGPDKHIYFAARAVVSNNVVVLKASDKSLIAQKTITNPTGLWSVSQKDIIFTPVSGGQWYGIVSIQQNTPGFTFKKAADSGSITFGSNVAVTTSFPPTWTQVNVYTWTSDESFIYALVYNQDNTKQGIMKFDPATDTIVSITARDIAFGGVGGNGDSQLWNICPNTGKLISLQSSQYGMIDDSITGLSNTYFGAFNWADNDYLNTSAYKTFAMFNAAGNLETMYAVNNANSFYFGAFFERSLGNFYTYAALPSPITKTSSQSLRVEYTFNY